MDNIFLGLKETKLSPIEMKTEYFGELIKMEINNSLKIKGQILQK